MIKQVSVFEVTKQEKTIRLYCDNDTPLGVLHDCIMELKGWTVERMIANQKAELEQSEKLQKDDCQTGCENDAS